MVIVDAVLMMLLGGAFLIIMDEKGMLPAVSIYIIGFAIIATYIHYI